MDTTAQNSAGNSSDRTTDPVADPAVGTGPGTGTGPNPPRTDRAAGAGSPGLGDRLASFRLRRSATDKMLGGVCGGLGADLGIDVALLRILVLVLTLATGGAAALVYLAVWLIAPVG
ncbi:PspC domain-containing protein [Pseudonocardia sp. NPDC049635]|uniref:PspC domain-containing protein n=1 Tax=Pseudonocardia sp. NPDC049635 TaxID=3155506 RepID=UPI0033DB466D